MLTHHELNVCERAGSRRLNCCPVKQLLRLNSVQLWQSFRQRVEPDGRARKISEPCRLPHPHFIFTRWAARRDFLRLAVALWITPVLAALSKADVIAR